MCWREVPDRLGGGGGGGGVDLVPTARALMGVWGADLIVDKKRLALSRLARSFVRSSIRLPNDGNDSRVNVAVNHLVSSDSIKHRPWRWPAGYGALAIDMLLSIRTHLGYITFALGDTLNHCLPFSHSDSYSSLIWPDTETRKIYNRLYPVFIDDCKFSSPLRLFPRLAIDSLINNASDFYFFRPVLIFFGNFFKDRKVLNKLNIL